MRRRLRRRREVRGVETSGREARWRSPPKRTRTRRNPTAAAAIGQYRIAISAAAAAAEAADLSKRLLPSLVSAVAGAGAVWQWAYFSLWADRDSPGSTGPGRAS